MSSINAFGQPVGPEIPDWRPPEAPRPDLLEGRLCRLEPLDAKRHGDALWSAWQLPDLRLTQDRAGEGRWTYLGGRPFDDIAGCREWLRQRSQSEDPRFVAIVETASDDALGLAAWLNVVPEHGAIEVGHLNFSVRLARTALATEALVLMIGHAFALGYRRLEWKCDSLNTPSRRAAQRLGLRFEGIFRQHRVVNGRNRDTAWYSLLDAEWLVVREAYERWLSPANFDAQGRQRVSLSSLLGGPDIRRRLAALRHEEP